MALKTNDSRASLLNNLQNMNNNTVTSINVTGGGAVGTLSNGSTVNLTDLGNGAFAQTYSPKSGITYYSPVNTSNIPVTYEVAPNSNSELASQLSYSKTNPNYTGYYRMDGQNYVVNDGKITLDNNYYRTAIRTLSLNIIFIANS